MASVERKLDVGATKIDSFSRRAYARRSPLRTLMDWLPGPIQQMLDTPLGPFLAGGIGLLLLLLILAALLKIFLRPPPPVAERALTEDLGTYPPAPPLEEGQTPLLCHSLPVRIRLIVVAPLGNDAGGVTIEDVLPILEAAMPGLAAIAQRDQPRVRLWPTQLSTQGFTASFRRHAQLPDPEATVKPWIQLCGRVLRHRRPFALGLALLADRDHTLGPLCLEKPHQWMEVLRLA